MIRTRDLPPKVSSTLEPQFSIESVRPREICVLFIRPTRSLLAMGTIQKEEIYDQVAGRL